MLREVYEICRPPALVERHFLDRTLDLEQVERLVVNLDGGLEDGLHLAQLACVARDEVDVVPGLAGGCG